METPGSGGEKDREPCAEQHGLFDRIHGEWVEILAAVLLSIAVVASAWSAYQAARWGSEEAKKFHDAIADRVHAAEAADLADQELGIDADMYTDYLGLLYKGDTEAAEYFETVLFRDEMKVAVQAWKKTDPFNNPDAPDTPFEMPEYKNEHREKSKALDDEAEIKSHEAKEAVRHSDNYVLLTVLFASVLFFAGICSKFKASHLRIMTLAMGILLFTVSIIVVAFQPVI